MHTSEKGSAHVSMKGKDHRLIQEHVHDITRCHESMRLQYISVPFPTDDFTSRVLPSIPAR